MALFLLTYLYVYIFTAHAINKNVYNNFMVKKMAAYIFAIRKLRKASIFQHIYRYNESKQILLGVLSFTVYPLNISGHREPLAVFYRPPLSMHNITQPLNFDQSFIVFILLSS